MDIRFNPFRNDGQNNNNNNNNNQNNEGNNGVVNRASRLVGQLFQSNARPPANHLDNQEREVPLPLFSQFSEPPETLLDFKRQITQVSDGAVIRLKPHINFIFVKDISELLTKLREQPSYKERDISHKLFDMFKYACIENAHNRVYNHLDSCLLQIFFAHISATVRLHHAMIAHKYYQIIFDTPDKDHPKELVVLAKKMALHGLVRNKLSNEELTFEQYILVYQNLQKTLNIPIDIEQKPDIPNPLTNAQEKEIINTVNNTFKKAMSKLPYHLNSIYFVDYLQNRYPDYKEKDHILNQSSKPWSELHALRDEYIDKLCTEAGEEEELFGDIKNAAFTG